MRGKINLAIKARSRKLLRACFDFNETSLARARNFLDKKGVGSNPRFFTRCRHRAWNIYDVPSFEACLNTPNTLSKTELRAAHPRRNPRGSSPYAALRRSARLSRGCSSSRRENAEMLVHSAFCKQNYPFTCSFSRRGRRGRCPRHDTAALPPLASRGNSGSPPKVFSVGQSERRSVYTVRRSIISMRDSNFIKKDEKYIPHFRRIVPCSEWGRNTRREGGGATFPARRAPYFTFEHDATSERVLHEFTHNSETNGDGVKMFILGRIRPS